MGCVTNAGCVGVWKLANNYLPVHLRGDESLRVVTDVAGKNLQAELDLKTAQKIAHNHAKITALPYLDIVLKTEKPIVSVREVNFRWHPVVLYPEEMEYITEVALQALGYHTKDEAETYAKQYAANANLDYLAEFGSLLHDPVIPSEDQHTDVEMFANS